MALFDASCIERDDEAEAGVRIADIGRAIMIWTTMQQVRPVSVAEAAAVFNTTPEIIREAVEDDPWAFLAGESETDPMLQFIEVDGA